MTLKKLLAVIGKYRLLLLLSLICAATSVVLTLYIPILFGDAIDCIIAKGNVDFAVMGKLLGKTSFLIVLTSVISWVMNLVNNRLAYRTIMDLRSRAIRQIQILPLSYLDGHSSGDIVQRVIADTDQISDGLLLGFSQLFAGVVTIIVTLIFMFSRDVSISLLVIILTPVSFLAARFISVRSYRMFTKQNEARGEQTALIEEMISGARTVRAFGYEERASARFEKINKEVRDYAGKAVFYSSLTNPSTRAVNNVIYALVILTGAWRIMAGGLTVGGLTILLSYANQYMKPFNDISTVITELQNSLACAARVFELIEEEGQSPEPEKDLSVKEGRVDIRDVSFSYDKDKPLIEHFNFLARGGTTTAIVGPTGCGKTTLINLLMRFYETDRGEIAVDGTDVSGVSRKSLRKSYGMVLQETWLKNATVRENITFGRPDASEEEIIRAAKEAHSWEFIRRLPDRLDTVINDESLSQGQKQLLCITRVMLCIPPMLILDEATSSIDTRTEVRIQEAFSKLMEGRTSFIVAHRLSTIRNADHILVMRDGRIIEQGDHKSLLEADGFYTKLYHAQFE